jgi:hypothetical protein
MRGSSASIFFSLLLSSALVASNWTPAGALAPHSPSPQGPAQPNWQRYVEAPGESTLSLAATGGTSYHFDVVPRGSSTS